MARMSDERMIRHENLLLLVKLRQWTPSDLARALDCSHTHASRLLRNATTFGEKAARNYEPKLGLVRGWFDSIHLEGEYSEESLKEASPQDSHNVKIHLVHKSDPPLEQGGSAVSEPVPPYFTDRLSNVTKSGRAPVITWERIGKELVLKNEQLAAEQWLPVPETASLRCKWVLLETDLPRFGLRRGTKVALEPVESDTDLADGEVCLFRTITGGHFIGQLRHLAGGNYEAVPDSGPPLERDRHGIKAVAIQMGTWK